MKANFQNKIYNLIYYHHLRFLFRNGINKYCNTLRYISYYWTNILS